MQRPKQKKKKSTKKSKSKSKKSTKKTSGGDDVNVLFCKGAPESVLDRCSSVLLEDGSVVPLTSKIRKQVNAKIEELSSQALRCLGLAYNAHLSQLPGR